MKGALIGVVVAFRVMVSVRWHPQMLSGRHVAAPILPHKMRVVLQEARQNLNKTVFFGISDYWNTTVCLFHKELNGPGPRPSEYLNVRKGGGPRASTLSPHDWAVLMNGTRYDRILYKEALAHFVDRATRFGCPLVPSSG